ncbi:SpoIIE family protein phosphatase [Thauera aromatica]|uniref:SpoIIE family protein phosphatase n=1 Tax=Thauera aromatica TaxID=59405 RepID=UPI001FFD8C35|nr:SpoIIE family protein phosphatase [Thauera aromatica]MCK2088875.1 SpoIIE family protein phosphatase [Thauera aromatica]
MNNSLSTIEPPHKMPGHRSNILIVDDAISNIETLAKILESDCDVSIATSGPKALDLLTRSARPDLILLDVMMPGMDGFEVFDAIKRMPALCDIPVIFITAMSDAASEFRALAAGAMDFIQKPFNPAVVLARVQLHLGLVQQRKDLEALNLKLAQSLLETQQAQEKMRVLATALEYSPTSVLITSPAGLIEYVNPHFVRSTGYTADEVVSKNPRLLSSGLTGRDVYKNLWATLHRGEVWSGELINRAKDGRIYRAEAHIAPVKDDQGRTSRYVAIQLDITSKHEAEQAAIRARQRELEISANIQQQLLFGQLPSNMPAYSIACFSEASQVVDGDFYTFTTLGPASFEVLTGDVMGKGVSAALVGAGVKNTYREVFLDLMIGANGQGLPSPAALINAIHARTSPHLIDLGVFVTLSLLRFDHAASTVTWVNAGHGPTLLATGQGEVQELLGDNMPLGVMQEEIYVEHVTPMRQGDTLLVFTDGLSEATDGQQNQYGIERVKNALQHSQQVGLSPQSTLDKMRAEVGHFTDHGKLHDDLTVILVQSLAPGSASNG